MNRDEKLNRNVEHRLERKGRAMRLPIKQHGQRRTQHKGHNKPIRREGKRITGDKTLGWFEGIWNKL